MTALTTRLERLAEIELGEGAHDRREDGMCAMEAVAWISGEPHSDTPECTCPVISGIMRTWNDALPDGDRTRLLRPLLPALIGTRGSEALEDRRRWRCLDWLVRVYTPAWLELAGLSDDAAALRALPPITGPEVADAPGVLTVIEAANSRAIAAESAARNATRSAPWIAGRSAAWIEPENVAWSMARAAAESAGQSVACSAGESAAMRAAWSVARSAAWSVAWSATWSACASTVAALQVSAQELIRELCAMADEVAS